MYDFFSVHSMTKHWSMVYIDLISSTFKIVFLILRNFILHDFYIIHFSFKRSPKRAYIFGVACIEYVWVEIR